MTITQKYIINKEVYIVTIKGKEVFYWDRKMIEPTRVIPMDERLRLKVIKSRNKLSPRMIEQFNLSKEEKKEYNAAIKEKDFERRLADICKKDCLSQKSKLLKEEVE